MVYANFADVRAFVFRLPENRSRFLARGLCRYAFASAFAMRLTSAPHEGKTMSYVEKIISDIIQIISDLFLPPATCEKTIC